MSSWAGACPSSEPAAVLFCLPIACTMGLACTMGHGCSALQAKRATQTEAHAGRPWWVLEGCGPNINQPMHTCRPSQVLQPYNPIRTHPTHAALPAHLQALVGVEGREVEDPDQGAALRNNDLRPGGSGEGREGGEGLGL